MVGETIVMFRTGGNFFLKIIVAVVNGFELPGHLGNQTYLNSFRGLNNAALYFIELHYLTF